MQLIVALWLVLAIASGARAQSAVDATSTVFYEAGGPLNMTVINPRVAGDVQASEMLSLQAGWEADVVSGASVAVVDAPNNSASLDAITSATKVKDFRNVFHGGATLRGDDARITASYGYGFENDYRSHSLSVSAATDLFERNTTLALDYSRAWDQVCDLAQPQAEQAVQRLRLPNSNGCFQKTTLENRRTTHGIDLQQIGGSWTQAWTPIFNTQWTVNAQLISGFQSNPYRAVWLGRTAAQEHHPNERARYGTTLSARVWLRPIGGALQLSARLYRDTWDVRSASGEVAYERAIGAIVRVRARARYYRQGAAAFYSDDYALHPRGQYFTGDRELSSMHSWLGGAHLIVTPDVAGEGHALSRIDALRVVLKADFLVHDFDDFHYGTAMVPNRRSIFATVSVETLF